MYIKHCKLKNCTPIHVEASTTCFFHVKYMFVGSVSTVNLWQHVYYRGQRRPSGSVVVIQQLSFAHKLLAACIVLDS